MPSVKASKTVWSNWVLNLLENWKVRSKTGRNQALTVSFGGRVTPVQLLIKASKRCGWVEEKGLNRDQERLEKWLSG